MKRYFKIVCVLMVMASVSCKKKFDVPDPPPPPPVSSFIKIDSIYKIYTDYYINGSPTKLYRFAGDVNLECLVTADETSGNIYKTVYVEDHTGALQIKLVNPGGLAAGDKIRINLNNAILNDYGKLVQLDSIDIEKRVVKLSSGNAVTPVKVTFNQLLAFNSSDQTPYQSRLVIIDSVQFGISDKSKPYADAVGKNSIDRLLSNSFGTLVALRTSGYASFAGNITPCGKGTMTVIVSQYNSDLQFILRSVNEVNLSNTGCPVFTADFESGNIFSGGWVNYRVNGTIDWTSGNYGGKNYAQITNYVAGNNIACETWFISPALNISSAANPHFSFLSAYKYTGAPLQVYVSTNYSSGNPSSATWTLLNPTLSPGNFVWTSSGAVSLNAYKSANTRIAFKYSGSSSDGSTWEIDDIAVFAE